MLYCHLLIHAEIYIYILDTYWRNEYQTQEDFFNKIFTSHFIAKVRKGLLKVCVWEGAGDRKETAIFWPSLLWPSRCVFLVFLMLNRRSRGPLCWVMASFTASYQHLLWAPIHQGHKPLRPGVAFLPSFVHSNWNSNWPLTSVLTALYNNSTPTRSPTRSLKSNVLSSSSRNNCHAVQRSLSSGASVYESIMGFFSLSHFVSHFPPTRFPLLTAIGMCHFLPVHHLEWHFGLGRRSKYNTRPLKQIWQIALRD